VILSAATLYVLAALVGRRGVRCTTVAN